MLRAFELFFISAIAVLAVTRGFAAQDSARDVCIWGIIVSGNTRIPGALISAANAQTETPIATSSDDQGQYRLCLPAPGVYHVRAELFGFLPTEQTLSVGSHGAEADFKLALARVETPASPPPPLEAQPSGATSQLPFETSRERASTNASSLSADMPLEFSFVRGQVAQPVDESGEPGAAAPLRQSPVHFNMSYQAANSALDASPYALHGIALEKPEYAQNTFGAGLGGTLPWGKNATTTLYASYSGNRSGNPYNAFATVPTAAMRSGDFSSLMGPSEPGAGQAITIYDPRTGQPFVENQVPPDRMSPGALALLEYIPLPNRDGVSQNFRVVSATNHRMDGFSLSLMRTPSTVGHIRQNGAGLRNSFSAGLGYQHSDTNLPNLFPTLGGNSKNYGWNANLGYTLTKQFFTNSLHASFSSVRARTLNHFHDDVADSLGITGVSTDSFDWGLPTIGLSQFTGLRDVTPALRTDRNLTVSDAMSWSLGKHNLKLGGEFRRFALVLRSDAAASGSFLFTGFATEQFVDGTPVLGTGSDFADFLLGLPQKTYLQYTSGAFSFNGDAWSLYFVDDWRIAKNVSLNAGLRYEYVSPFSEAKNRLATLDAPTDFSTVAAVRAGGVGPFTGRYPETIVAPDRLNLAPRLGIAWRAAERLILRAGYSISYDPSLYESIATRLAVQPPFAVEQTGIATRVLGLTLENGFPALTSNTVSNDFAAPRNLPLGYAQIWVFEIQNDLPRGWAVTTSYTGTKGSHLQMLRAPNRTATGLLLPSVAPFLWQTDEGSSILHAGSVHVQKRLAEGLSVGASYMFSRSIDDDPTSGDEMPVAQDDRNLSRERGLSAFDQRHRLRVDYQYELPFGRGRRWLKGSAVANHLLGDWSFSGSINYTSGLPLTPHVIGSFTDVEAGGYGALRPDLTGQPVQLSHPTVDRFFNTAAFTAPPPGRYGNAGRNIIIGPRIFTFDASVTKSFTIAERQSLQFRAQTSNVLNTPQFAQVDTNLNSLSYGQITGAGPMRMIQLGLRYSF
jgi:trimeric autotransporter adhesin